MEIHEKTKISAVSNGAVSKREAMNDKTKPLKGAEDVSAGELGSSVGSMLG